ncbi:MAG: lysine transporter LysE [Shewanella sp.]|uniref:LysE family translocator n=1 Tax=Shewanella sp. TaxID=50422 RepID=UPI001EC194E5|nr:LysE family translocator [Shewanella sp.]MBZ4677986.1 lysine transporter LysE [Shewanella sp.]
MEPNLLWPLVMFAFVSTVTPGPNNIMLMTSGANVGFVRTLPHMLGIVLGFSLMLLLVGIGVTGFFQAYPWLHQLLSLLCIAYMVYLALKIALSRPGNTNEGYRSMTFIQAALFQWLNPKGWSMALAAVSLYNPSASWQQLLLISVIFALVNVPSVSIWTLIGKQLSRWLTAPNYARGFNLLMGGLLLASIVPML